MPKSLLTRQELAAWLTNEIRKIEDCENCTVSGIVPLQEPDHDGCNWSSDIVVNAGGVHFEHFRYQLERIIKEGRSRFNVKAHA